MGSTETGRCSITVAGTAEMVETVGITAVTRTEAATEMGTERGMGMETTRTLDLELEEEEKANSSRSCSPNRIDESRKGGDSAPSRSKRKGSW